MSKNTTSILKQLRFSFLGFGLSMGLVFPVYANFFVDWKEGMLMWFVIGCIVAGITIGIVNGKLLEWLLIRKLKLVAVASDRIRKGDLREGCGVRSADTIGEITAQPGWLTPPHVRWVSQCHRLAARWRNIVKTSMRSLK